MYPKDLFDEEEEYKYEFNIKKKEVLKK